jgi:HK97 family phage portal protein
MGFLDFFKKQKYYYTSEGSYDRPYWTTEKDKQFITEAYNQIVWVYACVAQISSSVSSVPWILHRTTPRGKIIEVTEHPILNIMNHKANDFMSSRDFFDLWATYLAVQGKFYAEYVNPNMPTQLIPLYPHYMKPIPNKERYVSGYEYNINKPIRYEANEILWSKFNNPMDLYEGMSPIKALSRTIDTENEAVNWNKSTLQNSGVPAGMFSIQNPSPELIDNLKDEWKKRYAGGMNARLPLVLNADKASYQPIGLSSTDMDFINQRKLNRIEICSAFGVPSQLVGDPEGQQYSNFSEAVKSFWENTVIPRYLETIKDKINAELVPRYADNLTVTYDVSAIGALKESQDHLVKRTVDLWKNGLIKRNEARYALDYEDVPSGELFFDELRMPVMPTESSEKSMETNEQKKKSTGRKSNESGNRFIEW